MNRQSLRRPGVERLQVRMFFFQLHVLPATISRKGMRCVRKRSYLSLSFADESNNQTNSPEVSMGSIACFCCPVHGLLFHSRTRQFVLQCLTGVHGALDSRHHRCASGTKSPTRCGSRAVAVTRLQIREQIVDVPAPQDHEGNRGDSCW